MFEGIELFRTLSDTERHTLSLFCQERVLEEGDVLFSEGDDAIAMYVVMSGRLQAFKDRSSGITVLGDIGPGQTVGEMAIFGHDAKIRMASVRATVRTRLLVIVDVAIMEISRHHPELYAKLETIVNERRRENSEK